MDGIGDPDRRRACPLFSHAERWLRGGQAALGSRGWPPSFSQVTPQEPGVGAQVGREARGQAQAGSAHRAALARSMTEQHRCAVSAMADAASLDSNTCCCGLFSPCFRVAGKALSRHCHNIRDSGLIVFGRNSRLTGEAKRFG